MDDPKYQINVTPTGNIFTILEGEALSPEAPISIEIHGRIDAPAIFWKVRKDQLDLKKCHVLVKDRSITLNINEDDPFSNGYVQGQLNIAEECAQWGINDPKRTYDSKGLARLIKANEFLFQVREEWLKVHNGLMRFESNVHVNLKDIKETSGDMEKAIKVTVENSMDKKFTLRTRIFDNTRVSYAVEIGTEFVGNNVKFYLDSAELAYTISDDSERLLAKNIEAFKDGGIPIIYT